ncbi:hypothetical protein GOBAR_DD31875 [Gossypium barbadense]|nr:hypothetical protein GOBAR_DD31875 [Gossypium barbadense]
METTNGTSINNHKFTIPAVNDVEQQQASMELEPTDDFNYSKRSQWLRAAVLGANDGLVSTAALMMGVGAVKQDIKAMILTGFAGLVAGACSMAIASAASALSFSVGAMVPLLAASFIKEYKVRLGVVVGAVSLALAVFGWLGAVLGRAPRVRSAVRVLVGGWLAMAITFGLTKLIGSSGL